MVTPCEQRVFSSRSSPGVLAAVYALYFATGATALIFEILWTRQFVIVFGNSTYAMSVVLAAYMGGLGIGAYLFGRFVDRHRDPLWLFALIEGGIIVWALLIPVFLGALARLMPAIAASVSNLAAESVVRFAFSFAVLLVPCVLMGGTLPVLTRFAVQSREKVGARLSILYGLNTLGAAAGCFVTGFFLLETLGQSGTNILAVSVNLVVLIVVLTLRVLAGEAPREATTASPQAPPAAAESAASPRVALPSEPVRALLLLVAFVSGFATMAVEVLWVRYLVFVVPNSQYSFTSILGVLLFGLALGSLLYKVFLARTGWQLLSLALIEMALAPATLAALVLGAHAAMGSGPQGFIAGGPLSGGFFKVKGGAVFLAAVTVFAPSVLIGVVFPLVAAAYTKSVAAVGRSVGSVYAVNTLGSILGSLAPILFLVRWLGIQNGILAVAALDFALGVLILPAAAAKRRSLLPAAAVAVAFVAMWRLTPPNLTQEIFFSNPDHKGAHHEVLFYREGPTATVTVIRDVVSGFKEVYIGGVEEVPTVYTGHIFFKLFGSLGPLLHPDPKDVLVLCLGGGVAAGTIIEHPEVERVECVDLVEDMVGACRVLSDVNNDLVDSPKFTAVIEDARNYLVKSRKKFPVIICDSTHPKSPDSWPLYTAEFYRAVKGALADDGLFLQWAPVHAMSIAEYQIVLKTFQSVFPHASLWYVAGFDEIGGKWATTVMLATPERLSIDLDLLEQRLSPEPVRKDLAYWNLDTPVAVLSAFLCGEESLREWTDAVPVNTDDLPFTQYLTKFTGTTEYGWPELAPKLESVWPYLKLHGDPEDYLPLKASLDQSRLTRKILLERNIADALEESPGEPALLRMSDNLSRSDRYLARLAEIYRDDDRMLLDVARKMRAVCQYAGKSPVESFEPIAAVYSQALAVNPLNVSALADLGALAAAAARPDEARAYFEKALALDPDSVPAHLGLGMLLSDAEQYPQALEHLERAARLAPDRFDVHDYLAIALTAVGKFDEAVAHLEKAIALSAGSLPDLYYNLGLAYGGKGDLDKALENFRRAVSADPSSVKFHLWLGITLLEKGDTHEARAEFETVLSMDDANPDAHAKLGLILLREGRLDDSISEFRAALAVLPSDTEARENLANALVAKRDFPGALAVLRDGMTLGPTPEIARQLAWLLATCPVPQLRNGREAVALAENVDSVTGFLSVGAMDTLAAAYAEAGLFSDATKTARRALSQATLQRDAQLAAEIRKRLDLYSAGRPYHEE